MTPRTWFPARMRWLRVTGSSERLMADHQHRRNGPKGGLRTLSTQLIPHGREPTSNTGQRTAQVFLVLCGAVGGQAVVILSTPVLTRYYDPPAFGLLAVFTAVSAVVATGLVMRLDAAVTLPRTDKSAAALAQATIATATIIAALLALVTLPFARSISTVLGVPTLSRYWWLLALATMTFAFDQLMLGWLVRTQRYSVIAGRNLMLGVGQVVTQVVLALAGVGAVGLVIGLVVGRVCALGGLISPGGLLRQGRPRLRLMRAVIGRYRRFAYVSAWSALINSAGLQVPLIVIGAAYGQHVVGLVGLTFRVLAAPAGIAGLAVARVFQGEASAVIRSQQAGRLQSIVRSNTRALLLIGAPVAAVLIAVGPQLFDVIFGANWHTAGVFARILALGYLAQLAVSPISLVLMLLGKPGMQLLWDVQRFVVCLAGPLICYLLGYGPTAAIYVLSASYVVSYALLYTICSRSAAAFDSGPVDGATVTRTPMMDERQRELAYQVASQRSTAGGQ